MSHKCEDLPIRFTVIDPQFQIKTQVEELPIDLRGLGGLYNRHFVVYWRAIALL